MKYLILLAFLLSVFPLTAQANCVIDERGQVVCGEGECSIDQYGKVYCARVGGGALRDDAGKVQCGIGYCAKDDHGNVWCSRVPGGSAARDADGKVQCFGGCNAGTTSFC